MSIGKIWREFIHNAYNILLYFIFVYVVWAILYIVQVIFTEKSFSDFFYKSFYGLKSSIFFYIVISFIFAILFSVIEQWLFPYVMEADGMHRKHVRGYYLWRESIFRLEMAAVMLYVMIEYDTLHIFAGVVMLWLGIEWIVTAVSLFLLSRVMERWMNTDIHREKKVCTYITAMEATSRWMGRELDSILKPYGVASVVSGTKELLWEGQDVLICPHWLYKEYLKKGHEDRRCRLFVLTNVSFVGQDQEILTVIDEYLSKDMPVAEYIVWSSWFDSYVDDRCDKYMGRTITMYFEKKDHENKAAQFLVNKENRTKISYFNNKIYTHEYPICQSVNMKYKYADEEINALEKIQDPTECFYRLLKLVEYVWHYRALAIISDENKGQKLWKKGGFQSSLGLWEKQQNQIRHNYVEEEIVKAYRLIKGMLQGNLCGNTSVSYPELCEVLTQLRNRYVGHGTMAFSVSQELLDALKQLVGVVLDIFYSQEDAVLHENAMLGEQIPLAYFQGKDESMALCLLAGWSNKEYRIEEYLNYQNARFCSNFDIDYQLDYREEI